MFVDPVVVLQKQHWSWKRKQSLSERTDLNHYCFSNKIDCHSFLAQTRKMSLQISIDSVSQTNLIIAHCDLLCSPLPHINHYCFSNKIDYRSFFAQTRKMRRPISINFVSQTNLIIAHPRPRSMWIWLSLVTIIIVSQTNLIVANPNHFCFSNQFDCRQSQSISVSQTNVIVAHFAYLFSTNE